ncbi:hypothetical protein MCOR27_010908 [Pyricularia oryzae]|uniref:Nudix hydrolase domain-containing protein n=4 Tax=Pyricularia TaxID=48558 RepID=A0ABQ8N1Y2_PYRGI|nr:mRNA-decapping enzyme 2 [Pyricularia oryzae 70-15]ELQ44400.1 mRNA-decapping enzyme 2 [Pyricularia oryzae Y34]KAH9430891.1 hypothetical protein MCOR02_008213 [Pyricularia oryzae]KAI6289843.1 hypothetical protein MCOR33_011682 [Pyricularia grisea]EHA50840.1 mRNA-decapping enzyme 2 [Pyricularia oryzae 70-15]KAI6252772.1 hypothetical protein MCOR19_010620 [Pyricularia oryzae]
MAEPKMELEDWLDDLCVRFIINLPAEDLSSVARICFQVEEAQWFYEDFIRPLDPTLPSMSLRSFCLRIFQHCPLLASFPVENHMRAFEEFLQYKTRVPVRGAIMLNEAMDSTVLVKGWKKGANWSFPRGKINKDEDDLDCAIREVYEETGFDIRAAGLVPKTDEVKYIEINMREQQLRLYVFRNIPMDTHFEPRTRKEISKIQWYKLSELPAFRKKGHQQYDAAAASNANKFYMVAPFLVPLKKWVVQQKKRDGLRAAGSSLAAQPIHEEGITEDELGMHVDHVPQQTAATPAIETFEGANRELQRLLQVQPSTQGLQGTAGGHAPPDPGQDKGNALLALLQAGPTGGAAQVHPPSNPPPHTPLDHILSGVPAAQPPTPHHHNHVRQMHHIPPPDFPLGPHSGENQSMPHMGQFPGQLVGNNRYGPGHLPSAGRTAALGQLPGGPGHAGPPVAGGVPNPAAFAHQLPQHFLSSGPSHQAYPKPAENIPPAPQLSTHSMSLLSALRGNVTRPTDSAPANPPEPEPMSQVMQVSQTTIATQTSQQFIDQALRMAGSPRPVQLDVQGQTSAQTHKNALLGMFKSPTPNSAARQGAITISNLDGTGSSTGLQFANLPHPEAASSAAETIRAAAQTSGGPTQMDPTLHLPFGALKLLSRPQGLERGSAPDPALASSYGSQASHLTMDNIYRPVSVGNQSSAVAGHPHLSAQQPNLPQPSPSQAYLGQPVPNRTPSATGMPGFLAQQQQQAARRPSQATPEQKTLLLSLFSKQQTQQVPLADENTGKGKEVPMPLPLANQTTRPLSRAAVLASASGEGSRSGQPSPMGSQTPISPADRNFLLGYLQSVSNTATK